MVWSTSCERSLEGRVRFFGAPMSPGVAEGAARIARVIVLAGAVAAAAVGMCAMMAHRVSRTV